MFFAQTQLLAVIAGGPYYAFGMWFWLVALAGLAILWMFVETPGQDRVIEEETEDAHPSPAPHCLPEQDQPQVVREVMDVQEALQQQGIGAFRGHLRQPPDRAFEKLKESSGEDVVPMMQDDPQFGEIVLLVPKSMDEKRLERRSVHWIVNVLLFLGTIVTTTYVGAQQQGVDLLKTPDDFGKGLPYALGLLGILGVHELGHYFAARLHRINVTLPFFIPVPFALGTFGAFIRMKSPTEDRRSLLDVAVAGPLAGLAVAIALLIVGLRQSIVIPLEEGHYWIHGISAGSSIMFALLTKLTLGHQLQSGYQVALHPVAFAGWLGLFITALNLLPIGQLDGGHIARAMFGHRIGSNISSFALASLFLLGILIWPTLLIWWIIVLFIAGRGTPPLNDITPISPARVALGAVAFSVLISILIPLPHILYGAVGIVAT